MYQKGIDDTKSIVYSIVIDTKGIGTRGEIILAKRSNLVNERKEMHLTQDQLSTKLDIATVTLRKIENGSGLSNELAVKMANFFKKPLEYLFPDIFLLDFDTKGSKRNNPA